MPAACQRRRSARWVPLSSPRETKGRPKAAIRASASYGLPVAADAVKGFAGPLAGVLTGLEWAARNAPECEWVASFATDAPFLPTDMVQRMVDALAAERAEMACAASGGRAHPVFGLWPVSLADALRRALVAEEVRKVDVWTARYRLIEVDFPAAFRQDRAWKLSQTGNIGSHQSV